MALLIGVHVFYKKNIRSLLKMRWTVYCIEQKPIKIENTSYTTLVIFCMPNWSTGASILFVWYYCQKNIPKWNGHFPTPFGYNNKKISPPPP